jgi:hypothetical protein
MFNNLKWERVTVNQFFDITRPDYSCLAKGILLYPEYSGDMTSLVVIANLCECAYFGKYRPSELTFELIPKMSVSPGMGMSLEMLVLPFAGSYAESLIGL